jgi:hypothetical protein
MLDKKLRGWPGRFLDSLSGDANALTGLDYTYCSDQGIRLLIAVVLELEAVCPWGRAASQAGIMVNGEVDAEPDSRTDGAYGDADPDHVGFGWDGVGGCRPGCGRHEQDANRGFGNYLVSSCVHGTPQVNSGAMSDS